jgi:hypothetical protein
MILIKGTEGSGKSTLMKIADLFNTKKVGRFTQHALDYTKLEGYEVLELQEIGSMDEEKQGVSTIKFLSSDDKGYIVEFVVRDKDSGRFVTEQARIPPITFISSTVRVVLDSQFIRRNWVFNSDETAEQTKKVQEWKIKHEDEKAEVVMGLKLETSYDHSWKVLKCLIHNLKEKKIVIPFPETLLNLLSTEDMRVRGDYDKLLTLVKLYVMLKKQESSEGYVIAEPADALYILNEAEQPLISMMSNLEKRSKDLITILRELELDKTSIDLTQEARGRIAKAMRRSESTVRRLFGEWVSAGYMSEDGRKPKTFHLVYDLSDVEAKSSGLSCELKSHDLLMEKMQKEAQIWLDKRLCKKLGVDTSPKFPIKEEIPLQSFPSEIRGISTPENLHNSNSSLKQASLSPETSNNRVNQNRTIFLKDLCPECKGPIPADLKDVTFDNGQPYHVDCYRKRGES